MEWGQASRPFTEKGSETKPRLDLSSLADRTDTSRRESITFKFEPERLLEALELARLAKQAASSDASDS